jgi:polyisoprenoid-binding protein YceI
MRLLRLPMIAAFASLCAGSAMADVSTNPQSAPKGKYTLDPNHTNVTFCIKHMGIANYCGRFNKVAGIMIFNGSQPEKSSAKIAIDVASIDTPSDKLDEELRLNFFETAKFPGATFDTTAIEVTGRNEGLITGNLTLHGVTKPVTLKTKFNGGQAHFIRGNFTLGFSAQAVFKHAEFAFPAAAWNVFIGDEVTLTVETELGADQ